MSMRGILCAKRVCWLRQLTSFKHFSIDSICFARQQVCQAYALLGLDETANVDEIRQRYACLVRQLHPDTGGNEADADKLGRVQNAYKLIIKNISEEGTASKENNDEKDFGIQHTVPQHRQYLEYEGIGGGNPSTRQRQYQQYRVSNALDNLIEFTVRKTIQESQNSANTDLLPVGAKRKRQKPRLTGMLDRVAEDIILSSIEKGDFRNLKGAGKPLKMDPINPYIDETQQWVNKILRNSGFASPWIVKEKELRSNLNDYRQRLCNELAIEIVCLPNIDWNKELDLLDEEKISNLLANKLFVEGQLAEINRLIQNYNLIAPSMSRQLMPLQKDRELNRAKVEVLKDFPNSKYIVDARTHLSLQKGKNQRQDESSKGFIRHLLSKYC